MTREEFRVHFRQWREGRGLTQNAAAQALGVSLRTLQNWEIARNMPKGFGLTALLAAMDASRAMPGLRGSTPKTAMTKHGPRSATAKTDSASKSVPSSGKSASVPRSVQAAGYSGLSETHLL